MTKLTAEDEAYYSELPEGVQRAHMLYCQIMEATEDHEIPEFTPALKSAVLTHACETARDLREAKGNVASFAKALVEDVELQWNMVNHKLTHEAPEVTQ